MKGIWQARMNAQSVPPLPDYVPINEPQLASMLFDNSCRVGHFHILPLLEKLLT